MAPLLRFLVCLALLAGIAEARSATLPVWLVSNGFHSGLVIRTRDAGPFLRAALRSSRAGWMSIGWGDREFYMARSFRPDALCRAIVWPSASAVHLIPFAAPPGRALPHTDQVRFDISREMHARFVRHLESQIARDSRGRAVSLGPGSLPGSRFCLGSESFYFPKMCNLWVARALREAGIPLRVWTAIASADLVYQAGKHGTRTRQRRYPVDSF